MANVDLTSKFPYMKPVKSGPPLMRINGCGVGIYGKRDVDPETQAYVTTYCISLLFIPVFCLRAYRVVRATQGWYFLGRESLSMLAKAWNCVVLVALLATVGAVSLDAYTGTPAYKERRQMAAAERLVGAGRLAEAAGIYQKLAVGGVDQAERATAALRDLAGPKSAAAPLRESAGVFAAAAVAARRTHALDFGVLVEQGLKVVAAKGDSDPQAGLELLDAIRPLTVDTRALDKSREALLRKWVAAHPQDLNAVVPLAALLEQQDQLAEAKKLLLPLRDKLGIGEGARVLGTILGREGDDEGAYALLWPYAKGRLDSLHAAETAAKAALSGLWDRELKLLEDGKGPKEFFEAYKASGKDEQRAMVQKYVNQRIKDDPVLTDTQAALEREEAVVPVALELGMVMLHRAQGQTDAEARKKQLEATEHVFLAIQGVAGETEGYRLYLGQVYYWLGKQAEGKKLFDDLLVAKGRSFEALMGIALRLRDLGADPDARALAEEAYNRAGNPEEQHSAASLRAICAKDNDDEITWLGKCSLADARTRARLATALGYKAGGDGHDAEAARQFRLAIDGYKAMPRSETSLNDMALACLALFQVTGDRAVLDEGIDCFQQAVNLKPSDPVLLYNAAVTLENAALADVIGGSLDLRALHEVGSVAQLGYLFRDEAEREPLVKRVREHPGIAKALSYFDKVMLLSPKHERAYAAAYEIHRFTRDVAALTALQQRLAATNLDTSDDLARHKDYLAGKDDAKNKDSLTAAIKRADESAGKLRAKGGATAAAALTEQAALLSTLDTYTNTVDPEQVLKLAEEARGMAPSSTTEGMVLTAHLFRAAKDLRRTEPEFEALYARCGRSVGCANLIAVAASEPGPLQAKALANADVQKAMALLLEEAKAFPESRSSWEWALLKNANPAEAERAAAAIRENPRTLVDQAVTTMLNPASGSGALDAYWLMQILGTPEKGREAVRKVAAMGIPLPIQP